MVTDSVRCCTYWTIVIVWCSFIQSSVAQTLFFCEQLLLCYLHRNAEIIVTQIIDTQM